MHYAGELLLRVYIDAKAFKYIAKDKPTGGEAYGYRGTFKRDERSRHPAAGKRCSDELAMNASELKSNGLLKMMDELPKADTVQTAPQPGSKIDVSV